MANKIIHKHSSALVNGKAKLPTAEQLDYGEIAVNYAEGVETISLKNNSGDVVTFESQPTYKTDMPSGLTMVNAVGGINSGTTVSDLNGKTITSILDDLLFPTLTPLSTDHTNPSISGFTLSNTTSPIIINSDVRTITTDGTLNKGKWNKYDSNVDYAGAETSRKYEFTINNVTYSGNTLNAITYPTKYTKPGNHTYKITIEYGKGPAPKDSKGNPVDSLAAPATSVTATTTINVTYPWYATTATAGTLTQQTSLIKWNTTMTTGEVTLLQHTTESPQMFKMPGKVTKIQVYDTSTEKWKDDSLSNWTESITSNDTVNGLNNCKYYTYTYCGAAKRGSVKIKITFKNN